MFAGDESVYKVEILVRIKTNDIIFYIVHSLTTYEVRVVAIGSRARN